MPPGLNKCGCLAIKFTLTDSDNIQIVGLRPVDQPRGEVICCRRIRLVHQRDMAVPAGAGLLKLSLALGSRLPVPVASIDVVGDDVVAEGSHHGGYATTGLEVRRAHVPGLPAEDVDVRLLQLGHLRSELGRRHRADVAMCPGVRGDLVSAFVGGLDCRSLVVDASCFKRSERYTCA